MGVAMAAFFLLTGVALTLLGDGAPTETLSFTSSPSDCTASVAAPEPPAAAPEACPAPP